DHRRFDIESDCYEVFKLLALLGGVQPRSPTTLLDAARPNNTFRKDRKVVRDNIAPDSFVLLAVVNTRIQLQHGAQPGRNLNKGVTTLESLEFLLRGLSELLDPRVVDRHRRDKLLAIELGVEDLPDSVLLQDIWRSCGDRAPIYFRVIQNYRTPVPTFGKTTK